MSDLIVDDMAVKAALKEFLETNIGIPVGDSFAPLDSNDNRLPLPYLILRQSPTTEDSMKGPEFAIREADQCLYFMITSFGERADQVTLFQQKIKKAILARNEGSLTWVNDFSVANHAIMMRKLGLKGIMKREGTTFSTDDIYEFQVTSQV